MKIYVLICEQNTDYKCGEDVSSFIRKEDAQAAMRTGWEDSVVACGYNNRDHKGEDECYCEENSAVIRDGIDSVCWHIEEHELNVQVAVRVEDGMVQEVKANADIIAEVYDLDMSEFADEKDWNEAEEKEAALEELDNSPDWRSVW